MPPTIISERLGAGVWRFALPSETLPPFEHTNSYLVHTGDEAVFIDAGSGDEAVLDALAKSLNALGVTRLGALLLTHTHPDHVAGAAALSNRYGTPVYVHALEQHRLAFPTERLRGGDTLTVGHRQIGVYHTPGHSPGHLSFALAPDELAPNNVAPDDSRGVTQVVFVGDLLTATGSTWVGLPGGNVADYLGSLDVLGALVAGPGNTIFAPGHGPLVRRPDVRLAEVRAHRLRREAELLAALTEPMTLAALQKGIYPDVPDALIWTAEGSLLAQLEKLVREGRAVQNRRGCEPTWTRTTS